MKIAVITDAHANLPALQTALAAIRAEGCDAVFHTGDAIAVGPHPAECLDLLLGPPLGLPAVHCTQGNHEFVFVNGLADAIARGIREGELQHQLWTHAQIAPHRQAIAGWPLFLEQEFEGVRVAFAHWGPGPPGRAFAPMVRNATPADLDHLFAPQNAALVFYGHSHTPSDLQGRARYVNPGALGICERAVAHYCTATFQHGQVAVTHHVVAYDDRALWRDFEQRRVPDRAFIYQTFFAGRFPGEPISEK